MCTDVKQVNSKIHKGGGELEKSFKNTFGKEQSWITHITKFHNWIWSNSNLNRVVLTLRQMHGLTEQNHESETGPHIQGHLIFNHSREGSIFSRNGVIKNDQLSMHKKTEHHPICQARSAQINQKP